MSTDSNRHGFGVIRVLVSVCKAAISLTADRKRLAFYSSSVKHARSFSRPLRVQGYFEICCDQHNEHLACLTSHMQATLILHKPARFTVFTGYNFTGRLDRR